ncbi:Auxin-induced protein AUX28 [Hibiscus syriacus]|uniref:Auxin-responsive protein n=1 Tax=Hibiscus syriacus TaxID=106335 RepID=A0A6A2WD76_HIBSY|nr:Auxin-induced protein AUX28 [Hibiscus syriacus]
MHPDKTLGYHNPRALFSRHLHVDASSAATTPTEGSRRPSPSRSRFPQWAQVVGWPPVRSFRAKTLASSSKNNDEVDGEPGPAALFVKVSMDGAPYLRKVDLSTYSTYRELSSALEKMFSCFTLGQCGSHGAAGKEILSQSKLKDLLHVSEYVLTYKDKDGDWMLVGDVTWELKILLPLFAEPCFNFETCKSLKIMKSADAIGLDLNYCSSYNRNDAHV